MENENNIPDDKTKDELKDAILFNTLFEGLAEGADLSPMEARRAMAIMMIHNTADFILNNLFQYFFAADQHRGLLLHEHLLTELDLLKKANTLKKSKVIDDDLFKSLAKLNEIRVAIAHGKAKNDPRLQYKGKNILSASHEIICNLDEQTVQRLLEITEKVRRIRIFKDKWPEKPFIHELHDKDRE
ncbi:MAG: hypothetical protein ABH806_01880 [Candidatus Omnitrophota bacterium]